MPRDFFTDFVKVAQDEGRHFTLLAERLEEMGSFYGALPAHDGLWDSAIATSKDLLARLAIEHCVHEVLLVIFKTVKSFLNSYYYNKYNARNLSNLRCPSFFSCLNSCSLLFRLGDLMSYPQPFLVSVMEVMTKQLIYWRIWFTLKRLLIVLLG